MDMRYGHGHAVWTWTRNTDLVMQHGLVNAAWTCNAGLVNAAWIWTVDMHGCRNADKKLSPASLVFH
jgi:hypothetical protein